MPADATSPALRDVVDAHTHVFPAEVVAGRAAFCDRDAWFGQLYTDPVAALIGAAELTISMAEAGIGHAVVCGFPWADRGMCRLHNDEMATAAGSSGGQLSWLGIVSPTSGAAAAMEADRCFRLGAVGLGELNADAQGFDLDDPKRIAPVVEVCLAHDRPILLHASDPVGHAYPGKGTATPDRLLRFLAAFPALRVVLAHWGGGLPFYELMPEVAAITANAVYDTAASTYLYRFAVYRAVLDVVGADRVLFGSDFPVLRQDRFLRRSLAAGVRADEADAVFAANARRVYGLPDREGDAS